MRNDQGFSLVELLIVVAIIAIIAAIAVPSLLTSRQAANEASAIQGCRTIGSAEIAFAAVNNQQYTDLTTLVSGNFLDTRFTNASGFNGYTYASGTVTSGVAAGAPPVGFEFTATPNTGAGRYIYGIAPDQVVRYLGAVSGATAPLNMSAGDPIGKN
jgi:prepilin-type N-terminal cleavage/methylation domain-containing protein